MKTQIIATIGPASDKYEVLSKMVEAGMNIARINTKYGSFKEYLQITDILNKINKTKLMYDIKNDNIIEWLKNHELDYLAISDAETVEQILKYRDIFGKKVKLIAKIESKKGIDNLDKMLEVSDGIMVARGDLGKQICLEDVPIFQKIIISKSNHKKKFVITATEMLLSMVNNPFPGRAEVSDVANAVIDGSDAVMLSEETSKGKFPVEAVQEMKKIIIQTEKNQNKLQ